MKYVNSLNVTGIRPWWLRLFVLAIVGAPAICCWPINKLAQVDNQMSEIFLWFSYACIVWSLILVNVGPCKLLQHLSGAFIMAITVIMLGSIARRLFPVFSGGLSSNEISVKMIKQLATMVTVIPYAIFVVNSFSAQGIIKHVITLKGNKQKRLLHFALALRVIQHVGEVCYTLKFIWVELHPGIIYPSFKKDWKKEWYSQARIFQWLFRAISAWIFALFIHTFETVPVIVDEIRRIEK